jgi:hypothetical protein
VAELQVADSFSQVARLLAAVDAEIEVMQLLARSIENEHQHSRLCHRLAERYLGRRLDPPRPAMTRLPALDDVVPAARAAVHVAGLCCINESIATVWLDRCPGTAVSPLVRAVNRLHLSDEVVHARVGWAHLASGAVTAPVRAELGRWLRPLLRSALGQWLGPEIASQASGIPDQGLPTPDEHRGVVLDAVRDVVLPGFEHVGVDTRAARRWFRDQHERG